ncbi:hypothetical protein BCR33DRAFT_762794 [Rhizoclosmatium globosum]|uniref:Uncharacterized protein n=1 Tax=Rhizoclosmatium globosum TaxID=329046 RepID=A0A1Y2CU46_9FUNG|nr:hypothetical protein BCR33DRAFT_762794 [Rhizoclosmatium globosum]|eukprot:ORY50487.1 hypothetical protein BCR33DRAFT_762794 [Rhizoclosmatium globosum]
MPAEVVDAATEEANLKFLNSLSFTIHIKIETYTQLPLLNQFVAPGIQPTEISIDRGRVGWWNSEISDMEYLTEEQWNRPALHRKEFVLKNALDEDHNDESKTFTAPNGNFFTVRDMVDIVEAFEREFRVKSDWFGGVDAHHIFYEGFFQYEDGSFGISWGS